MSKMIKAGLILVILVSIGVMAGCVSKGFVNEEITKAKTEVTTEQTNQMDEKISQVNTTLSGRIAKLETDYATKTLVESELYNSKQEILKEIDAKIEEVKKILNELKQKVDTFKLANEDDIKKIGDQLRIVMTTLWKKLKAEKDGIDQAMRELDKLSELKPEGIPEPPETPVDEPEGE